MYTLRSYQREAVDAALACLAKGRNGILVEPTGSGKSLVIAGICTEAGGKTIVLQPTREILEQNKEKMEAFGVTDIGVYSASLNRKDLGAITFATIGSVFRKPEIFQAFGFDRIIVDECHAVNSKGGMYEKFITDLGLPTLGLTATPYRLRSYIDAYGNGSKVTESRILTRTRPRIFDHIIHITQVGRLFGDGNLCPLNYQAGLPYDATEIKLNKSQTDYDEGDLERYNAVKDVPGQVVEAVRRIDAKHVLAFLPFIAESELVLAGLRAAGISCATVTAKTPKKERKQMLDDFRAGRVRCVVNVGVLTTGFDFPQLDCVILGRPTRSLALYYQMTGRGVRPAPGKAGCLLIDLCDNARRFGRIETFYLFDQNGREMWRLESDKGFITGVDVTTGRNMEKFKAAAPKVDENVSNRVVTFGKYKDFRVGDLEDGYLRWCVEKFDEGPWKTVFAAELAKRGKVGTTGSNGGRRAETAVQKPLTNRQKQITELSKRLSCENVVAIHHGLRILAGKCDGAVSWDGAGFSKVDTYIGHELAERRTLSVKQAALGMGLIRKYRRQLDPGLVDRALVAGE
jgi:DNA repair protein RadD